jgi:RimJ/RimL family protein N-acetyltransferase
MGYAPEAAKLFLDFALENQLAQNVIAIINVKNEKSIRVAEKIEMKLDRETEWMGERVKVYKSL